MCIEVHVISHFCPLVFGSVQELWQKYHLHITCVKACSEDMNHNYVKVSCLHWILYMNQFREKNKFKRHSQKFITFECYNRISQSFDQITRWLGSLVRFQVGDALGQWYWTHKEDMQQFQFGLMFDFFPHSIREEETKFEQMSRSVENYHMKNLQFKWVVVKWAIHIFQCLTKSVMIKSNKRFKILVQIFQANTGEQEKYHIQCEWVIKI